MDRSSYTLRQDISLPMLQYEAKELLLSIAMMYEVLQNQKKQPVTEQYRHVVTVMHELVIGALEIFTSLYKIPLSEVVVYLQKNRLFELKAIDDPEHLQQQLLKKLYILDAMNSITINELLDEFNDTSGNILLGSAQRIKSLIMVMELLALRM